MSRGAETHDFLGSFHCGGAADDGRKASENKRVGELSLRGADDNDRRRTHEPLTEVYDFLGSLHCTGMMM